LPKTILAIQIHLLALTLFGEPLRFSADEIVRFRDRQFTQSPPPSKPETRNLGDRLRVETFRGRHDVRCGLRWGSGRIAEGRQLRFKDGQADTAGLLTTKAPGSWDTQGRHGKGCRPRRFTDVLREEAGLAILNALSRRGTLKGGRP